MSKRDPYSGSSYRITRPEWDALNEFFQKIEPPAQNELFASGLLQLNLVPEGKKAWLTYAQHQELKRLFEAVSPFTPEMDVAAFRLHHFLTQVAGLVDVPTSLETLHFNAFVLLRRGYKTEEITDKEYTDLLRLFDGLEQPDPDDMDLHDMGGHRALYNYLTLQLGIYVEPGRGPVWFRAKRLLETHSDSESGPTSP